MKRTLSLLLILLLTIPLFGCNEQQDPPAPTNHAGEDLVSIRVLTAEISHAADGTRGHYKKEYDYDSTGLLMTSTHDTGERIESWDETQSAYIIRYLPYDGTIDTLEQYTYDDHGGMIDYVYQQGDFREDHAAQRRTFTYDSDGRPQKLTYGLESDPSITQELHYSYDAGGALLEIRRQDGERADTLVDLSYDDQGRLIQVCYHADAQIRRVGYSYDQQGNITQVAVSCATDVVDGCQDATFEPFQTSEFAYDKTGKLNSRKTYDADGYLIAAVICDYLSSGDLDSVCYFAADGNLEDSFRYHYEGDQIICKWSHSDGDGEAQEMELTYDGYGDLIRMDYDDGSYVEYTYETLQVTAERAAAYQRTQFLRSGTDLDGVRRQDTFGYDILRDYYALIVYPEAPLHQTDTLRP